MKFAHLADCHIGGWREEELKELSIKAFEKAIEICIDEKVEFVIIAGDLFNTSLPSIDALKKTTSALKKLKDADIPIYIIPGSHDFSPSRKTMLDVLENAGLCINVFRYEDGKLSFVEHNKEIKLAGMVGLSGGLEKSKYENLKNRKELEKEPCFKIFLFHTLLTEFKPGKKEWEKIPSEPLSLLPKNFDYYAGGHPHFIFQKSFPKHGLVAYPGPLFPNNFKELEELKKGGFYIAEKKGNKLELKHVPINLKDTLSLKFIADDKTPVKLQNEIVNALSSVRGKIVTVRIEGTLKSGKTSDVDFKRILEDNDAYIVLKNTAKLRTKEFEEIETSEDSMEDVENKIIKEHLGKINFENFDYDEEKLINQLVISFDKEKDEGEKVTDFESRLIKDLLKVFKMEL